MNIVTPVLIVCIIALIVGVILTIAAIVMKVKVDERFVEIREQLPGANCGACGFAGCDDYANALVGDQEVSPSLCTVGGGDLATAIAQVLGVAAGDVDPMIATVMCRGDSDARRRLMKFDKNYGCKAATYLYGGAMACKYGCLGLGDCEKVCPKDAITIVNNLAQIDQNACVGCGLCVSTCPKEIIVVHPKKKVFHVTCNSKDTPMETIRACDRGCIGCKKCEKACKFEAVTVKDNCATINVEQCKNCSMCQKVCPTGAIINLKRTR